MKDGYIRVACASIDTLIGNVKHNSQEIKKVIEKTRKNNTQLVVFPELVLSGYTLEDLFLQKRLLNECLIQLEDIMHYTKGYQQIIILGLPFAYQNNLFNVSAILYDGHILGIVPKTHIPNYNEYYEGRRFEEAFEDNIEIQLFDQIVLFGKKIIFSCVTMPSFHIGVEICEDLWLPDAPSNTLALNGATIIANTSASNELT
ncbi:MAG: nitrilase-related carbon-nitrogen hydrolase, partial [Faecalibacillus sp.]